MSFEMAVDIGGTFTDLYVRTPEGRSEAFKSPTTPDDLTDGLFDAFGNAASEFGMGIDELLGETQRLVHGTTVSTNAIIEGDTARTAFLCTRGFEDTLLFREGGKDSAFDWDEDYPDPYIPRSLTFGINERVDAEGDVVTPLDEEQVRDVLARVAEADVEAIAVCLLWSQVIPDHERRIGQLIESRLPDVQYSLSHSVNPILREYRRGVSTAMDASIHDVVGGYFTTLSGALGDRGFEGDLLIITANGGVMEADEIVRAPIWTVDAGPTMLPVAALGVTRSELDREHVLALDMGGTSLDMSVVEDGTILRTREAKVGDELLGIDKVSVTSIGSGGGSIAWVDDGGLLHVGPESAGADPGPACYLRGGERPTVTDAALVLGYLNEEYFLGGEMTVDRDAAIEALEAEVGSKLDLDATEAAHAVYRTAVQDMVNGIQDVTIERGIDPRKYVLSGGGGALGTFTVVLARELGMTDVMLPSDAGVVSSIGGLTSNIRRDFSASRFTTSRDFALEEINATLDSLETRATEFFDRSGIPPNEQTVAFYARARYPNQIWDIEIELPSAPLVPRDRETLVERFHQKHENTYGFSTDEEIEFLHWRVEAFGERDRKFPTASSTGGDDSGRTDSRDAYFDGETVVSSAHRATDVTPGQSIDGPAFVDGETTTIVLPPRSRLHVTDSGHYHIEASMDGSGS